MTVVTDEEVSLEELAREYAQVKADLDDLQERKRELQSQLIAVFRERKRRRVQVGFTDEYDATATLVEPSRVQVDEDRLKRALGSDVWRRVSTPKLDRDKLEQAINSGEVDASIVAECSYDTGSPYVKAVFSEREHDDEG